MANILVIDDNTTRWDFLPHTLTKVPRSSTAADLQAAWGSKSHQMVIFFHSLSTTGAWDWLVALVETQAVPILLADSTSTGLTPAPASGWGLVSAFSLAGADTTSYGSMSDVTVTSSAHPVMAGVGTGVVPVATGNANHRSREAVAWRAGTTLAVFSSGFPDRMISAWEVGEDRDLSSGVNPCPTRFVWHGWTGRTNFNATGLQILAQSVEWLLAVAPPPITEVTPTGPTWVDDAVAGGGTWSTPTETGVTYTPSGTNVPAAPGATVSWTAAADEGYEFPEGATTTWEHSFPEPPLVTPPSCSWTHTFPGVPAPVPPPLPNPEIIVPDEPSPHLDPFTPPHDHHQVSIYEKGGVQRLFDLTDLNLVRWSRKLDSTGEAKIVLAPPFGECGEFLRNIVPMRHEVVIFFNGRRSWEGPVTLVQDHPGAFSINAKDVSFYLNRMVMKREYASRLPGGYSEAVIDRLLRIIRTEAERFEEPPLPINLVSHLRAYRSAAEPRTTRRTEAGEKYVYEELDDLAWRNGVDFGVAGRSIYLMDTDLPVGQVRRMTSQDFTDPVEVVFYGAELTTEAIVTDRQGRFVTHGPGTSPFYGRVELLHGNYAESDDPDAAAAVPLSEMRDQAVRDFQPRYPLPMTVRVPQNSTLKHTTFLELYDSLFPGVRVPLTAQGTVHEVSRLMKLKDLTVTETPDGVAAQVTLTPASEAADLQEE